MDKNEKEPIASAGKDVGRLTLLCTAGGSVISTTCLENWHICWSWTIHLLYDPRVSWLRLSCTEMPLWAPGDMYVHTCSGHHYLQFPKLGNSSRVCLELSGDLNPGMVLATEWNEPSQQVILWMTLANTLGKRCQTQSTFSLIPFIQSLKTV